MMKKLIIVAFFLISFVAFAQAKNGEEKREKATETTVNVVSDEDLSVNGDKPWNKIHWTKEEGTRAGTNYDYTLGTSFSSYCNSAYIVYEVAEEDFNYSDAFVVCREKVSELRQKYGFSRVCYPVGMGKQCRGKDGKMIFCISVSFLK